MRPLSQLKPGEKALIIDVSNRLVARKLSREGLSPGDIVTVKENDPQSQTLLIDVNNSTYRLFTPIADTIFIHKINIPLCFN
ncbi:MAG: ferrous iron transport protein A [Chitinophagales bacterium]|nr:ferrous iron transport protein A [Chitinophagales bacterium]MDW8418199.1 FeoA family protein [Chitinophagales bacterium]